MTDQGIKLCSYHFNRAECNNGVTAPTVGPGIPARILPLLKHILLPLTVGLLISHPSERAEEKEIQGCCCYWCWSRTAEQVVVVAFFHHEIPYLFTESTLLSLSVSAFSSFLSVSTHTHGPHSTSMEPTFSTPASWRLLQGPVSSWQRPWKFSCS